jgi:hypothetical protein
MDNNLGKLNVFAKIALGTNLIEAGALYVEFHDPLVRIFI